MILYIHINSAKYTIYFRAVRCWYAISWPETVQTKCMNGLSKITRQITWRHISLCKHNNGWYCGGCNRDLERCGYRTWGFFNTLTSGQVVTGLHTLLQSIFLWMQMLIFHVECPWSVFFKNCLKKIVLLQLALIIWDFSLICIYLSFLCHYIVPMQTCLIRRITKLHVIHAHMDRDKAVFDKHRGVT